MTFPVCADASLANSKQKINRVHYGNPEAAHMTFSVVTSALVNE
jgi:hypothetical protein